MDEKAKALDIKNRNYVNQFYRMHIFYKPKVLSGATLEKGNLKFKKN
jgi:hypothetical protein